MFRRSQSFTRWSLFAALGFIAKLPGPTRPVSANFRPFSATTAQTFFALSLTPPADAAANVPHDVVIMFDTSASQAGEYRDAGLAAVEACIAKLGPQDRVQILAVDLEARR